MQNLAVLRTIDTANAFFKIFYMQGQTGERWRILCEQAAKEQDHDKLLDLIREINDLLAAKQQRLANANKPNASTTIPGPSK